jgi:hypothetical protein
VDGIALLLLLKKLLLTVRGLVLLVQVTVCALIVLDLQCGRAGRQQRQLQSLFPKSGCWTTQDGPICRPEIKLLMLLQYQKHRGAKQDKTRQTETWRHRACGSVFVLLSQGCLSYMYNKLG